MSTDMAKALETLVIGWGGIFLVMVILFLAIRILLKTFKPEPTLPVGEKSDAVPFE
ncbi:MAG: OadG-related small transporter subunit [Peptoniphilaceae bacterium]|nr:OadG-related small transporter subunit [Peptoniphilaceae bacterium]MDY6086115.1 OadG-related small transporter subunit [Peptoniphilaceae bacterium]